jgi:hypothetical protein
LALRHLTSGASDRFVRHWQGASSGGTILIGDLVIVQESVMPPHCDSMDGPVVLAAKQALDARDATLALPYVKAEGEREVLDAFDRTIRSRNGNAAANALAEQYFFETVVRVHRAGEGAPYTGLKPAGLGFGPVVPVAERAIETGSPDELVQLLTEKVRHEVAERFGRAMELKEHADEGVPAARAYVEAMLGLQVWSHKLYGCASAGPHDEHGQAHDHGD